MEAGASFEAERRQAKEAAGSSQVGQGRRAKRRRIPLRVADPWSDELGAIGLLEATKSRLGKVGMASVVRQVWCATSSLPPRSMSILPAGVCINPQ